MTGQFTDVFGLGKVMQYLLNPQMDKKDLIPTEDKLLADAWPLPG